MCFYNRLYNIIISSHLGSRFNVNHTQPMRCGKRFIFSVTQLLWNIIIWHLNDGNHVPCTLSKNTLFSIIVHSIGSMIIIIFIIIKKNQVHIISNVKWFLTDGSVMSCDRYTATHNIIIIELHIGWSYRLTTLCCIQNELLRIFITLTAFILLS